MKQSRPVWYAEYRKLILRSADKLQHIPDFTDQIVNGLTLDLAKMKATPKKMISTADSQRQSYILRWVAEPLQCSMDTPPATIVKHFTRICELYAQDKQATEALQVIGRFLP